MNNEQIEKMIIWIEGIADSLESIDKTLEGIEDLLDSRLPLLTRAGEVPVRV
jgi:hypothetical protein